MAPHGFNSAAYPRARARGYAPDVRRLRGFGRRLDNPTFTYIVVVLALVALAHVVNHSLFYVAPDLHTAIADVPSRASEQVSAFVSSTNIRRQHWNSVASMMSWKVEQTAHALDLKTWKDHGPLRDEYGHLTFDAQCQALTKDGIDPGWPLVSPSDAPDGKDGLPFADAKEACDYMNTLPEKLKVYTFALPSKIERRYQLARLAPTFNRAYDVEAHVIGALGKPPFATTNVSEAMAFLFPNRPYLDRVVAYPDNGRDAVEASLAAVVENAKTKGAGGRDKRAWEKSKQQGGCSRVFVNAHDQGTESLFSKRFRGDNLGTRTVAVVATADTTTAENVNETLDVTRFLGAHFAREKDVSMVCSLSFHLPADAIHLGAIVPLPTPGTGGERRRNSMTPGADDGDEEKEAEFVREEAREEEGTTTTNATTTEPLESEDHRPVSLAFRGNTRGSLRSHVIPSLRSLNRSDWDLEADGATTPSKYMKLLARSRFCLHLRGTRVYAPRLIEAMLFGCVPVIVADGYDLPLSWFLDWDAFSVRMSEREGVNATYVAEMVDAADWRRKHDALRRVIGFFLYHDSPVFGDALWATAAGIERQISRGRACENAGDDDDETTDVASDES
jgi:hypothetical protein